MSLGDAVNVTSDVSARARQRLVAIHEQFRQDHPEYVASMATFVTEAAEHVSEPRRKRKRTIRIANLLELVVRNAVRDALYEAEHSHRLYEWKRELRQIRAQYSIPSETVSGYSREYIEVDLMCRLDPLGEL